VTGVSLADKWNGLRAGAETAMPTDALRSRMSAYEIELGQVVENRDARTGTPFEVTVDVYVQEAAESLGDLASADHRVTFAVEGDEAHLRSVDADPEFSEHALVACKAAARELDRLQEEYRVRDPVATANDADYTVVDQAPA
jgi:hypothetical protein